MFFLNMSGESWQLMDFAPVVAVVAFSDDDGIETVVICLIF